MYNFEFIYLINNLLPHFLRKEKMLAWLVVLLKPVMLLYNEFLDYRAEKLYESQITGQVISLEKMLNDAFPEDNTGAVPIYITDSVEQEDNVLMYNASESDSLIWIFNNAEIAEPDTFLFNAAEAQSYDFFVNCDVALGVYNERQDLMISLLAKYKLSGTTYQIITLQ